MSIVVFGSIIESEWMHPSYIISCPRMTLVLKWCCIIFWCNCYIFILNNILIIVYLSHMHSV